ncbi:MAG: abhydrolase domain-containing protein 6 [Sphingobacteriales bacterium]|jgi:abhydrolase domain-containing protein 6
MNFTYQASKISYEVYGESGPWIVCIHGLASTKLRWYNFAKNFKNSFQILIIDLPGHGESDYVKGFSYSLEEYSNVIEALMMSLSIEKSTVIGHSMGAQISVEFANLFKSRVESLVLVSCGGIEKYSNFEKFSILIKAKGLQLLTNFPFLIKWIFRKGIPTWIPISTKMRRDFSVVAKKISKQNFTDLMIKSSLNLLFHNTIEQLGKLNIPMLFCYGKRDGYIPNMKFHQIAIEEVLENALKANKKAKGSIFLKSGHRPHVREPQIFHSKVREFLINLEKG